VACLLVELGGVFRTGKRVNQAEKWRGFSYHIVIDAWYLASFWGFELLSFMHYLNLM
jgi:hypothetical protein